MAAELFTWKRIRKLLNDIHLWMGLAAGLILFVVCLTGTIYTFKEEIEQWIEPNKYWVEVPEEGSPLAIEEIIARVQGQVGEQAQVYSVSVPTKESRTFTVGVRKEGERRGTNHLVNPYTGEVLGNTESIASEFFMVMFRLHRWLMLDTNIGRPIVGWATVIFVFLILSGMVIWVPKKVKAWKQGLKIMWKANWKRVNHDLHITLGFYASIVMLLMALTGLQWSFDWYRTGLYDVLGVEGRRGPGPADSNEIQSGDISEALTFEEIIKIADTELDYAGNYNLSIPADSVPTVSLSKSHVGFFASSGSDQLTLNRYTGEVLQKEVFSEKPFNEKVGSSIKAIHMGYVFGTFSKIIYFISCLIATSLPITGTIIWFNKLKKKRKSRKKKQMVGA